MAIEVQGMAPLLQVFDMPTSIAFYCDVLGFEIISTDGKPAPHFNWALLRLNVVELMLNTAYEAHHRPLMPDPVRVAAHDDTAIYFGCPDVDAAYAHLRARGVAAMEPKVAHYGMKQLYVSDPDGYNFGPRPQQRDHASGRKANRVLHLLVGHSACGVAAQYFCRFVVG